MMKTILLSFLCGAVFIIVAIIAVILYNSIEFINSVKYGWKDVFKDREGQSDEVKRANANMRRQISNHKTDIQ